jgi:hypothetical protein
MPLAVVSPTTLKMCSTVKSPRRMRLPGGTWRARWFQTCPVVGQVRAKRCPRGAPNPSLPPPPPAMSQSMRRLGRTVLQAPKRMMEPPGILPTAPLGLVPLTRLANLTLPISDLSASKIRGVFQGGRSPKCLKFFDPGTVHGACFKRAP